MADLLKRIEILIASNSHALINDLRRGQTAIGNFSSRTMAVLNRTGQAMNGLASKYMNGVTMLAGGAGFTYLIHQQANFEDSLREIGRTSGGTAQKMASMKSEIMGLISPANKLHIALSKEEWAGVAAELNNTGISLDTIQQILPQIGMGAEAAHADTKQYAATMGDFLDKYKVQVSDLSALQDSLNVALKMPDVKGHTNEFLQAMSQIARPMRQMGIAGKENTTQIMALLAELGELNGGDFGSAGTNIEQMFKALSKFGKNMPNFAIIRAQLKSLGINFFDPHGKMKPFPTLLPELKKLAKEAQKRGYATMAVFQNVFNSPEAANVFADIADHEDEVTKKTKQLGAAAEDMQKDFAYAQGDIANKWKVLKNQFEHFALPYLNKTLDELIKVMAYTEKHPGLMKGILTGGVVAGGALVTAKTIGVGKELYGFGKDIYGLATGKGKSITPVYVTNMGSMSGSLNNAANKIGQAGLLLKATNLGAAGALGYEMGTAINRVLSNTIGGKYSGQEGALGNRLYDWLHKDDMKKEGDLQAQGGEYFSDKLNRIRESQWGPGGIGNPQNQIILNVHIDSKGKIVADSNSPSTRIDAIAHGNFFPTGGASEGW